jgi:hypothetical protein
MGEYIPQAPVNEEARKRNGNLPGMGGVYNYINLHTYHYAGNNPVKYIDPTGSIILQITSFAQQNRGDNTNADMGSPRSYDPDGVTPNTIGYFGCLFTAVVNIGNTINHEQQRETNSPYISAPVTQYAGDDSYFVVTNYEYGGKYLNMNADTISALLEDMTGRTYNVSHITNKSSAQGLLETYDKSKSHSATLLQRLRQGQVMVFIL